MNNKEVFEMIEERRREEPEFRKKYDAFLAKRRAEGKLSDNELDAVNGGEVIGTLTCPQCGEYTLYSFTMGIYNKCDTCGYSEWFIGW